MRILTTNTQCIALTLKTDEDFIRSLEGCGSLLQRNLFQVLVQDCLDHSTRHSSNFRLKSFKDDIEKTMGDNLLLADKAFIQSFPSDIRAARKMIGAPKIVTYACCPACSSLYPPKDNDGFPTYPYECISKPCQAQGGCDLLKLGSTPCRNGIDVPKHPFVMQDFHNFVGCLLSRPGVEAALQQSKEQVCNDVVEDILTANGVREIKGPDSLPFLSGGQPQELCLLWCLSVDFFNPYHNKIAGKVASVGSIILSCLLLPPDMQQKIENLCLLASSLGPVNLQGRRLSISYALLSRS